MFFTRAVVLKARRRFLLLRRGACCCLPASAMALIKSAGSGSDMSLILSVLMNFSCMLDESGGVQRSQSEEGFKSCCI